MTHFLNNTTPVEALVIMALTALELAVMIKSAPRRRRKLLLVYGLALVLYITLIRRLPRLWMRPKGLARLEFVGFKPMGFLLNLLLFLPLGLALTPRWGWLPLLLSAFIEVTQHFTGLGMFDLWDIAANALGGLAGITMQEIENGGMKKMRKIPFSAIKIINVLLVMVPFSLVWFLFYEPRTLMGGSVQVSGLVLFGYTLLFYFLSSRLDGFRVMTRRISELILSQITAAGATDVAAAILIWMLSAGFPNLLPGLFCFVVQCAVVVVVAYLSHRLFFATHPPKKAVIVYDVRQGIEGLISAYGLEKRFAVQAVYPVEEIVACPEKLMDTEVVFVCGVPTDERDVILKYCIDNNKRVFVIPCIGDVMMSGAEQINMFHLPFVRAVRYNPPLEYRFLKRAFDICISGAAMLLFSPLFLIVALLVKSDGGPVLYKQVRLTKDGKEFEILKFRSMCVDAEKYSGAVLSAGENDPRITKVGRVIRAFRLDELPQLWNIFVGDMSIVGPRPERPEIAARYEEELPEFRLRLQCKAGLTGYAQVYGKYNTKPYDKLLMDLMYIAHPSLMEDFLIMLATVPVLFFRESTEGYGVESVGLYYEESSSNRTGSKAEAEEAVTV